MFVKLPLIAFIAIELTFFGNTFGWCCILVLIVLRYHHFVANKPLSLGTRHYEKHWSFVVGWAILVDCWHFRKVCRHIYIYTYIHIMNIYIYILYIYIHIFYIYIHIMYVNIYIYIFIYILYVYTYYIYIYTHIMLYTYHVFLYAYYIYI